IAYTASTTDRRFLPASLTSSAPTPHAPPSAMADHGLGWPWDSAYANPGASSCPSRPTRSPSSGAALPTPARHRAPLGRRGRPVLGQLSHLSRPGPGGPDVARWPALLRSLGSPAGGSPPG